MKLVIFDVDGTLVDSQHLIVAAMEQAFTFASVAPPSRAQILSIVGLSLPVAVAELAPGHDAEAHRRIVNGYRHAFMAGRALASPPLYDGARACLDMLASRDDLLLAVATGKSRRGLDAMIEAHDLQGRFISLQTADDHPSKPHPSMILRVMSDTGVAAGDAVMIGDTTFDMEMARSAGVAGFGVSWGYHDTAALSGAGAALIAGDFASLGDAIRDWAQ